MSSQMNYKSEVKTRLNHLKKRLRHPITLKKLAQHLQIQYTYLSRILNSEDEHLKEDILFEALHYLEFPELKIQLLMNLRILEGSTSRLRKEEASQQIAAILNQEFAETEERGKLESNFLYETDFMLDPYATIVLSSLSILLYKKDPRKLLPILGLEVDQLDAILNKIEKIGFIQRGEGKFNIKKVNTPRLYFRDDNQLMRAHQLNLKQLTLTFLGKISEKRKKSFMTTFVADEKTFDIIKDEFSSFIKKVEKISREAPPKKTYQLSFDLFDWT